MCGWPPLGVNDMMAAVGLSQGWASVRPLLNEERR
jgi:hypothetical protein